MQTVTFGFDEIFALDSDTIPTLKRPLVIADIPLMPGMQWRQGYKFAGWDIANHMGQPLVAIDMGDRLHFLGFATLDQRNPGWAKGWGVINNKDDSTSLFGFYPTEHLASEALRVAGKDYAVFAGAKRFGNNDDFIRSTPVFTDSSMIATERDNQEKLKTPGAIRRKRDYHDVFDEFVLSFGGRLVRDLFENQSSLPDNADYFFEAEKVIAELKVMETNREDSVAIQKKIQAKFDEWFSAGKLPSVPYGTPTIQSDKLPQRLQWELQKIHSKPVRRLIEKANKQIKLTKDKLGLGDAKGLVLLLNQQDRSQLPEYLTYAVHQSLIGDKYFTSVNTVSIFTENLTISSPNLPPRSRLWIDYTRSEIDKVDPTFLARLRISWTDFLSSRLGIVISPFELTIPIDLSSMKYD